MEKNGDGESFEDIELHLCHFACRGGDLTVLLSLVTPALAQKTWNCKDGASRNVTNTPHHSVINSLAH